MGTVVFLLVFVGGWIGLGRYWWRTSRHRVLSVLGAGALCFVVGAFAGSAIDGAMTTSPRPVAAAVPRAKAPAPAPMAPTAPAPVATASTPPPAAPAPPDEPNVFERRAVLEKKALAGDYQAQRNLAYSLGREIPINELQSCTWRIVILESGSDEVDDSDVTNKQAACDRKLSPDATYAAGLKAATLQDKIAARRK
ncbi:MAG: hypothetical protein BGO36_03730 [Burkholderiales bacterium 68-10]|jgi:hypothetical protein|nr:MAG: hypothetical protein BGO36_03730 [Burkholderiales bacterium 68-10]